MKNKLTELIDDSFAKQYEKRGLLTAHHTAEDLIANGMTIQRWIPANEPPKEEWQKYTDGKDQDVYPLLAVVIHKQGGRYVTKLFYTGENFVDVDLVNYTHMVTHWMPLPEPPKEEA